MSLPCTASTRLAGLEDDRLLQRASAGDHWAFERLVERHSPWLLHLIGQMVRDDYLAQDLLQQVWLQLYRSLSTLRTEGTLKAWLARVARNRCLDELRRTKLLTFSELAVGEENEEVLPLLLLPDPTPLPEELLEWHELQESLWAAIGALPPRARAVMVLRTEAQLSYGEIGQILRMSASTARATFFRAKRLLRAARQLEGAEVHKRSQVAPRYSRSHGHLAGARASGRTT